MNAKDLKPLVLGGHLRMVDLKELHRSNNISTVTSIEMSRHTRKTKPETLAKRPKQFPGNHLKVANGQLWCGACFKNIGSGKKAVEDHCYKCQKHKDGLAKLESNDANKEAIQTAIHDFKGVQLAAGQRVQGMGTTAKETQFDRAECLEEILKAGIHVDPHGLYLE